MSAPGRGRGESKKVDIIDTVDERIEIDREAQMEAARAMGMPESEVPVRGRGGFRQTDLRTMPPNVTNTRSTEFASARQVDILANYVSIVPMASRFIHMYRVDYEPLVESANLMRFLGNAAGKALFEKPPIFDGAHEYRSPQKLRDAVATTVVEDVRDENRKYTVKIAHTGTSSYGPEMSRIYNMHMKKFLRALGFYSPQAGLYVSKSLGTPVGSDIMMLRGFRTSANEHDGNRMLMNLEGAHKLVQVKNVLSFMTELRNMAQQQDANVQEFLRQELIGKVVVASYNSRVYRVEDIEFTKRPTSTFERNGEQVTFIDFYQSVHKITVRESSQPLLKVVPNNQRKTEAEQSTRETLLLPELCNIAGLTSAQRRDNRLKMDLIRASQIPPQERVRQMRDFLQAFHNNKDIKEELASWAYSYGTDAVRLKAHILATTRFTNDPRKRTRPHMDWQAVNDNTADLVIKGEMASAQPLKKVAVITMRNQLRDKQRILSALRQGFQSVGLDPGGPPMMVDVDRGDSARDYIEAIRNLPRDCELAIVVMAGQNKERYDAIKKAASVERGLITQVVTARLLLDDRKARSAASKIAVQIAAKVGGEPWWVDIPLKKAMVCGYDTYHDTAKRGRSYGAFVASLNNTYSRWWSKADAHDRLEEISAQISTNIAEAINQYRQFNNGEVPERILVYRDGVGEGQLEHVFRVELEKLKEALTAIEKNIRLSFIIVNKRIGARFYMRGNDNNFVNPPPGTIIDHTVTRQERYDFFLVSQSTRQGTVTPTYYNIIHDEVGFSPDVHQKMAFKLCHLYYNWWGTVRVPAPCQYAHKLALLCGEHLHAQPNSVLDNKLHFL